MALTKCKECSKEISTEAERCPHCGAKPAKPTSTIALVVAGLVLIGILQSAFRNDPQAAKPPPNPQQEIFFKQAVGALMHIKRNMKNPASLEVVAVEMVQGPAICIVYRGTNSFNATITSRHVFTDNGNSGSDADWNKHCAGKSGENFLHARQAVK